MDMKPTTAFRLWVQRIWMENCEERLTVGQDRVTMNQYWNTYKYWLKREYQHQKAQDGQR
jgi:hypothetical protein